MPSGPSRQADRDGQHPDGGGSNGASCELHTGWTVLGARAWSTAPTLLEATPVCDGPDDLAPGHRTWLRLVHDPRRRRRRRRAADGARASPCAAACDSSESRPGSMQPPRIVVQAALAVTEWQRAQRSAPIVRTARSSSTTSTGRAYSGSGWQLADRRGLTGDSPDDHCSTGATSRTCPMDFSREPAGELVVVFRQRPARLSAASRTSPGCLFPGLRGAAAGRPATSAADGPPPSARIGTDRTQPLLLRGHARRATTSWRR